MVLPPASPAAAHWLYPGCSGGEHLYALNDPFEWNMATNLDGNDYGWAAIYGTANWTANTEMDFTRSGASMYFEIGNAGQIFPIAENTKSHLGSPVCGAIWKSEIFLNQYYMDSYDLATKIIVATHEVGHTVGYADVNSKNCSNHPSDPLTIMFATLPAVVNCGISSPTTHDIAETNGFYN